jgi:hypothetical protein
VTSKDRVSLARSLNDISGDPAVHETADPLGEMRKWAVPHIMQQSRATRSKTDLIIKTKFRLVAGERVKGLCHHVTGAKRMAEAGVLGSGEGV